MWLKHYCVWLENKKWHKAEQSRGTAWSNALKADSIHMGGLGLIGGSGSDKMVVGIRFDSHCWQQKKRPDDWSRQELGCDWLLLTLSYFPRPQAIILDFRFWMITHEPLQLKLRYETCWLVKGLVGIGHQWPWPTFWDHRLSSFIFISLTYFSVRLIKLKRWGIFSFSRRGT